MEEIFPEEYPWTIEDVGERLMSLYRKLDIEVEIEYFEGWLEYVISRVSHGKKGKIKIIKSPLQNEHPCEYAIFLTGFLEKEEKSPEI